MAIYDYDGAKSYQSGKVYDYDGTKSYQAGKVYDYDGTKSYQVYSAELLPMVDNTWTTQSVTNKGNSQFSVSTSMLKIISTEASSMQIIYTDIDVTDYDTMQIELAFYALYSICAAGLYKGSFSPTSNWLAEPIAGYYYGDDGTSLNHTKQTHTYNVSGLSGVHRFAFWVYKGSNWDPWAEITNIRFE